MPVKPEIGIRETRIRETRIKDLCSALFMILGEFTFGCARGWYTWYTAERYHRKFDNITLVTRPTGPFAHSGFTS